MTSIELSVPEDLPTVYTITTEIITSFSEFSQERECGYLIESYELAVEGEYTPLDLGMVIDDEGQITILTTDSNLRDKSYSV